MTNPISRGQAAYVLFAAFLSGAAVMVVEMTAVRLLQPFFGSTNYVWTNVIAVVLAALSLGYWVGGKLSEVRGTPRTYFGLLALGACLVAVSAPLATPVAQWLLPMQADLEGVMAPLVKASLAATLILLAPAMVVLGMVSPLAIRILSARGAGAAAGRVFACSTAGSIVGTYLPTILLIPEYGSRTSILIGAAMLLVPAVIGLLVFGGARGGASAAAAIVVVAPIAAFAGPAVGRAVPPLAADGKASVLAEVETPYQYVTVRVDRYPAQTEKLLTINEGVYTYHSFEVEGSVLTGSRYYDDYSMMPVLLDLPDGAELRGAVVGLACGVTARQWNHFWGDRYKLSVDGAEIDPEIIRLGREHFHLPAAEAPWLRAYAMDGRHMLHALSDRTYHMIAIDAFANELYIPFHLGTVEFFELCRDRLVPGGVMAMNVYANSPDAPNLIALERTVARAFGSVLRVRQTWGGNFLLVARRGSSAPDVSRLVPYRVKERFGTPAVPEWDGLVGLASRIPWRSTIVVDDPAVRVLTDDHCPLEHLTDDFLDKLEREVLTR